MKIINSFLKNNPCYKENRKITVKGLMLHSVGTPQPSAEVFIKKWNVPDQNDVCVHAFIDANSGDVYQTLPWDHRGWHAGGPANNTHIGVEMCEPNCIKYTGGSKFTVLDPVLAKKLVKNTYESAVKLFAQLCDQYNLNPLTDIVSHSEGFKKGIASGHADPEHLWTQVGMDYTMDSFRKDVANNMKHKNLNRVTDDAYVWNYLKNKGLNDFAIAGIMGNLSAESGIRSNNLQNSYEKSLGMTDEEYVKAVDTRKYSKDQFIKDKAGFGLCQWTFWTRKKNLYEFLIEKNKKSISDFNGQVDFFWMEISGKTDVMNVLRNAKSVKEASDVVLLKFERPANQTEANCLRRASIGEKYYNEFSKNNHNEGKLPDVPFLVKVEVENLNIRKGPGTNFEKLDRATGIGTFTIVEVSKGTGSEKGWGKLKSGLGWVSLDYCIIK